MSKQPKAKYKTGDLVYGLHKDAEVCRGSVVDKYFNTSIRETPHWRINKNSWRYLIAIHDDTPTHFREFWEGSLRKIKI